MFMHQRRPAPGPAVATRSSRAKAGLLEVNPRDHAHQAVGNIVVRAKQQRLSGLQRDRIGLFGGPQDLESSGDAGSAVVIDRFDVVADLAVDAIVVGQAGRLEQVTAAELAVDAGRVAVGAAAEVLGHAIAGLVLAAVVVERAKDSGAQVAALARLGAARSDAHHPLATGGLAGLLRGPGGAGAAIEVLDRDVRCGDPAQASLTVTWQWPHCSVLGL